MASPMMKETTMAIKVEEAWVSSSGAILAAKKKNGGWLYFVNGKMLIDRKYLEDYPLIAREISSLNLEIMEAKR